MKHPPKQSNTPEKGTADFPNSKKKHSRTSSVGIKPQERNPSPSYLKKPVAPSVKRGDDGRMDVTAIQALRTKKEKADTGLGKEIIIRMTSKLKRQHPETGMREHYLVCYTGTF